MVDSFRCLGGAFSGFNIVFSKFSNFQKLEMLYSAGSGKWMRFFFVLEIPVLLSAKLGWTF